MEMKEFQQSCTFKPQIIESDPKLAQTGLEAQKAMLEKDKPKDKCLELFEMSKYQKRKVDKH